SAAAAKGPPSPERGRSPLAKGAGWTLPDLAAWTLLFAEGDLASMQDHRGLDGEEALRHSLAKAHALLDNPAVSAQLKHTVTAYARLIGELGRAGDVAKLLVEHARWKAMSADKRLSGGLFENFHTRVKDAASNASVASQLVAFLAKAESSALEALDEFIRFIGPAMVPLLIDQMRELADKEKRHKLRSVLASVCLRTGSKPLLDRLSEEDWFVVSNVVAILGEMARPDDLAKLPPLLKHGHRKVREAAVRVLVKSGGSEALEGLASFVETASDEEGSEAEALTALIALSQARHPGLDKRLMVSFGRTQDYGIQVGIASALGRIAESPEVIPFLVEKARRSWYEILTGAHQELHEAAMQSLERLRKDGKA
ncbi:MAG: HEAT repeat domain-containing protein, partial [Elusimicrobiota bacterium]